MYRWALRVSGLIFAAVVCFCGAQAIQSYQRQAPFGTTVLFELNTLDSAAPKAELARELSQMGEELRATICKASPDKDHYLTKSDLILFAGPAESELGPLVDGEGSVHWLDQGLAGEVVSPKEMGTRSLNGTYCATDAPGLYERLSQWAQERSVTLEWRGRSEGLTLGALMGAMLANASGRLIPACTLLLLAAVLCASQRRRPSQQILLVGGISYGRVRAGAAAQTIAPLAQGFAAGLAAFSAYVLASYGDVAQLVILLRAGAGTTAVYLALAALLAAALSAATVPSFDSLSSRSLGHSKALSRLGAVLTLVALAVIVESLYLGMSLMRDEQALLSQSRFFEGMPDATRVSLQVRPANGGQDDPAYGRESLTSLLEAAEGHGQLMMSLDVNQSMELSATDLGGYDHLVIVNAPYLDAIGVGIGSPGPEGKLVPLKDDEVPEMAWALLGVWRGDTRNDAFSLCRYEGDGLLALGPGTSGGGDDVVCENPLVLVVSSPIADWNYDGFVGALLSTGNIFFSGGDELRALIEKTGSGEYIASVDRLFERAQSYAQIAARRAHTVLVASAVAASVVAAMAVTDALSWSALRRRLIFARHSGGEPLSFIALGEMRWQLVIALLAVAAAGACEALLGFGGIFAPVAAAATLYSLCQVVFRCVFASASFDAVAARRGE